ncbi:hypothetical protein AK812_SmicGene45791, partial [Symbiodinium microadriaticum]
ARSVSLASTGRQPGAFPSPPHGSGGLYARAGPEPRAKLICTRE